MSIPTIDLDATAANIKRLRLEANLSVKDIQTVMGFSNPTAVYKWEYGVSIPSIDNLLILSALYGIKIDDILRVH